MAQSVLIFDDATKSLNPLADALSRDGFRAIALVESKTAGVEFAKFKPELVIIGLKSTQPLAACEEIRRDPDGAIAPIIFIGSGEQDIRSPMDALAEGGDYYFEQPIDLDKVVKKVRSYVGTPDASPMLQAKRVSETSESPVVAPAIDNTLVGPADALLAELAKHQAALAHQERVTSERQQRPKSSDLPKTPPPLAASVQATQTGKRQTLLPPQGELSVTYDIPALLFALYEQKTSGRLELQRQGQRAVVFVDGGTPVAAQTEDNFDKFEEYLLREGKLTRADYQKLRIKNFRNARHAAAYLATQGAIKPSELFETVRLHAQDTLYNLFEWQTGRFTISTESLPEDEQVALETSVPTLIFEGIRRKYLLPRLTERVGGPSTLLGPNNGDAAAALESVILTPQEQSLLRLLDGTRSIEDLVFTTSLDAVRVYHFLAGLLTIGYATVLVADAESHAGFGLRPNDEVDLERIREKTEQVHKGDYFQILGLSRTATAYEIERAFERASNEFKPNRFSVRLQRDLREELQEIQDVLTDARDVLANDSIREAYLRNVPR